jgi:hypothetical protein
MFNVLMFNAVTSNWAMSNTARDSLIVTRVECPLVVATPEGITRRASVSATSARAVERMVVTKATPLAAAAVPLDYMAMG